MMWQSPAFTWWPAQPVRKWKGCLRGQHASLGLRYGAVLKEHVEKKSCAPKPGNKCDIYLIDQVQQYSYFVSWKESAGCLYGLMPSPDLSCPCRALFMVFYVFPRFFLPCGALLILTRADWNVILHQSLPLELRCATCLGKASAGLLSQVTG